MVISGKAGFLGANRNLITHAVSAFLEAIHLPSALAIINQAAHQKASSLIAKGNNLADEVAMRVATSSCIGPI